MTIALRRLFLLTLLNISGWTCAQAQFVQITNGSFSDGFNGWTRLPDNADGPSVDSTVNPPSGGGYDAVISSTDGAATYGAGSNSPAPGSDSATDIENTLGIKSLPSADFTYSPTDGQAIYQTFTLTEAEYLSFDYSFATDDEAPYDSVGYTVNGAYTQIQEPTTPEGPTPYAASGAILLQPGTNQIGFVAFNTADNNGATTL
jgi:hypothetical protein